MACPSWLTDRQKVGEGVIYVGDAHDKGKQTTSEEGEDYLDCDDSAELVIEDLVHPSDDSNAEEDVVEPKIIVLPPLKVLPVLNEELCLGKNVSLRLNYHG